MSRPKLLLLYEPSMGLAPRVIKDILSCLRRLHEEGLTILLVEQDAQMALRISGYGNVMRAGKISLDGDAEELLQNKEVKHIYLGQEEVAGG